MQDKLVQTYSQLTLRERVLVLLAALALIISGGWFLVAEPIYLNNQSLQTRIQSLDSDIATTLSEIELIQTQLQSNPNKRLNEELSQLQQQIAGIENAFIEEHRLLVEPASMAEVIKEIMQKAGTVDIVSMKTQTIEPHSVGAEQHKVTVFKHPIELKVEGSYFEIESFVASLKDLPYTVYWQYFDYQTEKYPKGTAVLRFYTISLSEVLLSV